MYAPIVIFTYKRLDTLKGLLESLENNPEAKDSDMFVYSDLNEDDADAQKVNNVRTFLKEYEHSTTVFRTVHMIFSQIHKGLADSIISGVTEVLDNYGKVIVLEDDLTVSKCFLAYMNRCLDFYENDARIWSVSGYSSHIKEMEQYDKSVYLDRRASSWGWGTWRNRWNRIDWDLINYRGYFGSPVMTLKLCRGGNDLPGMLREQMKGNIDSWAVRWVYYQNKYNMFALAPVRTMVINNGFGEDASNCDHETYLKYGRESLCEEYGDWESESLEFDRKLARGMRKKHSLTLLQMIKGKIACIRNS